MALHAQNKGKEGEREVARALNEIIRECAKGYRYPLPPGDVVQRNQNQSAVGGSDLSNTLGVSIEVKRQEQLSINTWWKQTIAAAERNSEIPVLVYRQNRKPWRVVMLGALEAGKPYATQLMCRVEVDWETFLEWYKLHVRKYLEQGGVIRV